MWRPEGPGAYSWVRTAALLLPDGANANEGTFPRGILRAVHARMLAVSSAAAAAASAAAASTPQLSSPQPPALGGGVPQPSSSQAFASTAEQLRLVVYLQRKRKNHAWEQQRTRWVIDELSLIRRIKASLR